MRPLIPCKRICERSPARTGTRWGPSPLSLYDLHLSVFSSASEHAQNSLALRMAVSHPDPPAQAVRQTLPSDAACSAV